MHYLARSRANLAVVICVLIAGLADAQNPDVKIRVETGKGRVILSPRSDGERNVEGNLLLGSTPLEFEVTAVGAGNLHVDQPNSPRENVSLTTVDKVSVNLGNEGDNFLVMNHSEANWSVTPGRLTVERDTTRPRLRRVEIVERPRTGTTIVMTFDEKNLSSSYSTGLFELKVRNDASGAFVSASGVTKNTPEVDGDSVFLPVVGLRPGLYRLNIDAAFADKVSNVIAGDLTWNFVVPDDRKYGQHVEFTPFAPPTRQKPPKEGFNPGDYVETRVARLYYFRDAARVAQIINRNVRSFNQAAVTQAERRAEESRDDADAATDERRKKEREAVRAAEQARRAEQQLAQSEQSLAEAQRTQQTVDQETARITEIRNRLAATPPITPEEQTLLTNEQNELTDRVEANQRRISNAGGVQALATKVAEGRQTVANLRRQELAASDELEDAAAKETRAKERQFRDEVTAAETDPDTYVAGDPKSVDPVTQVSISVIGEGLIQLRGPIKGINKIRTMINQIDSPVGQIKVGVFTVQVNGEEGDKMEKVVGNTESAVDLSRFLVNQSLNLLRRAIQTEAARIAEQCDLQ
ncbi:MAG: hypothetical protein AAGJ83_06155, partial [Planctomycetota bacterium]